jgi:hypothetical protein
MSSEIDDGGNGEMEVGVEIEPSNQGHTQEEEIYAEYDDGYLYDNEVEISLNFKSAECDIIHN